MKLAICAQGEGLEAPADQRFGRCPYFVIVEAETGELLKSISNSAMAATGGAGPQSARQLSQEGIEAVVVGHVGPNAAAALKAAGITVYGGVTGTVKQTWQQFHEGQLPVLDEATVDSHHGIS
ncbi:MAG: NifB/NifX family molybdenum-iron cluster-binding protein [Dethiobacteria bacterium]|nr:NifB/NifX family molybdenum-iron cluster-binding protein [Bacillota bacterium]NMD33520.1 dinitrogenase iron-molybdenum cofactor biosynthesis protein [Bacillota bacterium]HOB29507.1 NifB/NifX family molybdenum-iron cluster-binding protein [Bacillota bacterium]HPZ42201.1 NifB/NifX family molybdenum-iron cluster-binding protein [Bacillota bacterium]HQD53056.1 NifB/NifX family molybdenum-iron cluster-binding protein [Bacillota bacterium]